MMKNTFILIILISFLYSETWNVSCKGELQNVNIKELPYSFGMENEGDNIPLYGELETYNTSMPFYDDTSPACGGDGTSNKLVFINSSGDDFSYNFNLNDKGGYPIHSYNSEAGLYENATTFVNDTPCMPISSTSMTVGVYNWNDNKNLGLTTAYDLNDIFEVIESVLTDDEISTLKSICGTTEEDGTSTDYTAVLNKIANHTEPISNIDTLLTTINTDLDTATNGKTVDEIIDGSSDMESFTNTFESTLSDTFTTYNDVFGFSGYGIAPEPISFTLLGQSYVIFDITTIGSSNVELIRNTFLLFSYLFGFILIFRTT